MASRDSFGRDPTRGEYFSIRRDIELFMILRVQRDFCEEKNEKEAT